MKLGSMQKTGLLLRCRAVLFYFSISLELIFLALSVCPSFQCVCFSAFISSSFFFNHPVSRCKYILAFAFTIFLVQFSLSLAQGIILSNSSRNRFSQFSIFIDYFKKGNVISRSSLLSYYWDMETQLILHAHAFFRVSFRSLSAIFIFRLVH